MAATHVALWRAINVGGNNKLPMKDLAEIFVAAGCADVQTYIQSGNVLFTATPEVAAGIANAISATITQSFGYRVPVVLRTAEELAAAIANNPYLEAGIAEDF